MKNAFMMVAVFGSSAAFAAAVPISGEISFSGGYAVNNPNLSLATAFTSFSGVTVAGTSGDYAVFPNGTASAWSPFGFDPFAPVSPLWSIAFGPGASFDLEAVNVDFESPSVLVLSGSGTGYLGGGFDATPGNWNLTANTFGTTFSFSSSAAVEGQVADGGSTIALLGLVLLGAPLLRRVFPR
jgi:hypothetical protein